MKPADLSATDVECEGERMRAYASVYSGRCARARLAVPDSLILITLQAVSMWDVAKDDDISALRARATTLRQTTSSSHVTESYLHLHARHKAFALQYNLQNVKLWFVKNGDMEGP